MDAVISVWALGRKTSHLYDHAKGGPVTGKAPLRCRIFSTRVRDALFDSLDLRHTAIDEELNARDVTRFI